MNNRKRIFILLNGIIIIVSCFLLYVAGSSVWTMTGNAFPKGDYFLIFVLLVWLLFCVLYFYMCVAAIRAIFSSSTHKTAKIFCISFPIVTYLGLAYIIKMIEIEEIYSFDDGVSRKISYLIPLLVAYIVYKILGRFYMTNKE